MNTSSNDRKRPVRAVFKIVLRLLSVPCLMVVGIVSGIGMAQLLNWLVSTLFPENKSIFYSGVTVFGATVVLSTIQDIMKNIPDFYTYVFTQEGDRGLLPFIKSFGSIFLASFGLMISIFGYNAAETTKANTQPPALNLKLEFENRYALPLLDNRKPLLVAYIFFGNDANHKSLDNNKKDYSVWPDPNIYEEQMESLVEALSSCADETDGPVKIQIRGFASSNKWKSAKGKQLDVIIENIPDVNDHSDAFNFFIANKRAENVKSLIEKQIGDRKSIEIIDFKWKKYKEMNDEMRFEDVDSGTYIETRGLLTRRVEIRVLKAPACMKQKYE